MEPSTQKNCSRCKQPKPVAEFYKCKSKWDGLQDRCKACIKELGAAYRASEKNQKKIKARSKRYFTSEEGRATRAAWKKTEKGRESQRRERQSEKCKARMRRQLLRDRAAGKSKARDAVHNAVRAGKLPSPFTLKCQNCDQQARGYHHHRGYEKPFHLDVIPLCAQCHKDAEA